MSLQLVWYQDIPVISEKIPELQNLSLKVGIDCFFFKVKLYNTKNYTKLLGIYQL